MNSTKNYGDLKIMKHKMIALILALTVMSWAQTTTQTSPTTPQQSTTPAEKGKCPCCDKMSTADAKEGPACCAHHADNGAAGKEVASCCTGEGAKSCCGGKDAKSCMRNGKDKAACCSDCKDKTAAACCAGLRQRMRQELLLFGEKPRKVRVEMLRSRTASRQRTAPWLLSIRKVACEVHRPQLLLGPFFDSANHRSPITGLASRPEHAPAARRLLPR